jgi:hypothetical protein
MKRQRLDHRRIKIHWPYAVDEVALALTIAKGTVRRWLKGGLQTVDARRPALIRGADLIVYMKSRRRPKQPCPLGECYCFKCRASRKPASGKAEYITLNPVSGNLRATCSSCGSLMHRRTSIAQLDLLRGSLAVAVVEAPPRLIDSPTSSPNDHL